MSHARGIWRWYVSGLRIISSLILILIVLLTLGSMLARVLFEYAAPGADEASRFMLLWLTVVAAALAAATSGHLAVTEIVDTFPVAIKRVVRGVVVIISLVFAVWFIRGGLEQLALSAGRRSPAMDLPMTYVLSILPIAGVLLVISILGSTFLGADDEEVSTQEAGVI